jgi:hypothetical protein
VTIYFSSHLSRRSTIGGVAEFVPPDFDVPHGLETSEFMLEPLGPEHNEQDYDAWTSSMEHIAGTPGYPDGSWPREMTRDENRADLQRHADDFRNRKGFTYTVLDLANRDVIGCVYIYPLPDSDYDACALSTLAQPSSQPPGPPGRTIVSSATTMSSSLAIRLYGEGHYETKESPMRSVWVDLITEDRRPLWPDSLKPC